MALVCEIRDTLLEVTLRRETATNLWIKALTTVDGDTNLRANREAVNIKRFGVAGKDSLDYLDLAEKTCHEKVKTEEKQAREERQAEEKELREENDRRNTQEWKCFKGKEELEKARRAETSTQSMRILTAR